MGGQATRDVDFARFANFTNLVDQHAHRRGTYNRVFDQQNFLALKHLGERRIFHRGLGLAVVAPFDKCGGLSTGCGSIPQCLARPAEKAIASAAALLVSGTGTTIVFSSRSRSSSRANSSPRVFARQVDAPFVECAGHVGKIYPLKETMRPSGVIAEAFDANFSVGDRNRLACRQRLDRISLETQIH